MAESDETVVGVLGLGRMGRPIAAHIARGGFSVVGYDPVAQREDFEPNGIRLTSSAAETFADADIVYVIVGYDNEVRDLLFADDVQATLRPGHVIVIVSTVLPFTLRNMADDLPAGVVLVDCPVARGPKAADEATLLAFAGGEEADVGRCRPSLRTFCSDVEHVGPIGSGQVAKMANNLMLWAAYFGIFEAMQLLRACGADMPRVLTALRKSSASSFALELWPFCTPVWGPDDLHIARQVADRYGIDLPVTRAVSEGFDRNPLPEKEFR